MIVKSIDRLGCNYDCHRQPGNEIKLTAQGDGKYTYTMPSRAVTAKATFASLSADAEQPCDGGAACPSHGFTDLGTAGTWYHEAVDYILRNGLTNSYSSTLFGPNDNLPALSLHKSSTTRTVF